MTEYIAIEDDNVMTHLFARVVDNWIKAPLTNSVNGVPAEIVSSHAR